MESKRKKRSVFAVGEILNTFSSSENESDQAFRMAMFNGIAILSVIVVGITTSGIYFILQPFLKPLIWALVCGSVLHPFKQILADKLRTQVMKLENDSKPLYVTFFCIPFSLIFKVSDALGDFLMSYRILLLKTVSSLCCLLFLYFCIPNVLIRLNSIFFGLNKYVLTFILNIFGNTYSFVSVLLGFISALHFLWTPAREGYFYLLSVTVWVAFTSWISNYFGYIRLPVFVAIQFIILGSFLYSVYKSSVGASERKRSVSDESNPIINEDTKSETQATEEPRTEYNSVHYIKWLAFICLVVLFISIPSILYVFMMMLMIYGLRKLCINFGIFDILFSHTNIFVNQINSWFLKRKNILYPAPLRESYLVMNQVQKQLFLSVRDSCDSAAAVAVILALLFLGIFCSVFLTLQAYREGIFLIQVGSDVINKTIIQNPDIHQLLPEDWKSTTETAFNNAYLYAREGITTMVRSLLKSRGINEEKSLEIENGALELWDRVYQAWLMPLQPAVGPTVTPDAVLASCYSFLERLHKTPEVMSVDSAKDFIKENMALLTSGLDSAWAILKGNMSLLLGIISTLFSVLFGGGLSVINFAIHSIIFLTALFYLLSTSREMYKPVELITQLSPKYGKRLALAVENSCQEVLAASAKLSIFYGLWTWLIHKVFLSNLAYMPAVFAGILGVVPVFGTYWVCVPAMIDLWFVQESKLRAIGLFIAQLFPTAIVETVIYNEIQGGHPYLTGLSVAGGIFWLGIEGAIAGPLLLCFLFVTLNMLSSQTDLI